MDSKLAQHLSNAMKVQKAETPPPTTGKPTSANDAIERAKAAAAGINSRLGKQGEKYLNKLRRTVLIHLTGAARPGAPVDNRGPDAGAFHATLEINDFPQKARWAVTNRTNVAKILGKALDGEHCLLLVDPSASGSLPEQCPGSCACFRPHLRMLLASCST